MRIINMQFLIIILLTFQQCICYPPFDDYIVKFNKIYTNGQYKDRKLIYEQNIKQFAQIHDYTPGINQFTDQTQEQFEKLQTLKILPNTVNNKLKIQSNKIQQVLFSLDWRKANVVTSVKNQLNCGTCWSFAAVAYAQSKLIIQKKAGLSIDLSQQYLYQCTPQSTCASGYLQFTFESLLKGIPSQQLYPYSPNNNATGICSTNSLINIGSSVNFQYGLNESQIMQLLQIGPIAVGISSQGWNKYSSGVYSCSAISQISHAALLVGYTQSYWIVKNQWGANWGQNGYIRINKNTSNNCRIGQAVYLLNGFSTFAGGYFNDQLNIKYFLSLTIIFLSMLF